MSVELMIGAKGLFIADIVSIALVLVALAALIRVSGWLAAVATCYCPDGGILATSLLLAA
jgi:hypothetical protein